MSGKYQKPSLKAMTVFKLLKWAAVAFNSLLAAAIIFSFARASEQWDEPSAWLWFMVLTGCPIFNLLGVLEFPGRWFTFLAGFFNAAALCLFGGVILLMMVWPMGSKPKGLELASLLVAWLGLFLTEVVLLRLLFKNPAQRPS